MSTKRLWAIPRQTSTHFVLTILGKILNGGAILLQAWFTSQIISEAFLQGQSLDALHKEMLFLLLGIIARAIFAAASNYTAHELALQIKARLREELYAHLLKIGPIRLKGERTGELVNTLYEGVEALEAYFAGYLPQIIIAALIPAGILFLVFPLDWLSGLVFLLTAPLIPFFMVLIGRLGEQQATKQWKSLNRLAAHYLDILQGLETLKTFGQSKQQSKSIAKSSQDYARITMKVLQIAFLSALALELLTTLSTAVIAVQIGLRLLYAQIAFQKALFILILAPEFYLPLRELGAHFHDGMTGTQAARQIFDLLDLKPDAFGKQPTPEITEIAFEQVSFQYPDSTIPSVQEVSFTLEKGVQLAIIGPSGAGKSTLSNLLLGFIQHTQGRILVNGGALNDLDIQSWRQQISWISQNPFLVFGSILENLQLSAPKATQAEIIAALEQAELLDFVNSLPNGIDTLIGERGTKLSGGQAQRLAIARALLKNAPLLILDEPTASLDRFTERKVLDSLAELAQDRTSLIITHRLQGIQQANQILYLENGGIQALANTGQFEDYPALVDYIAKNSGGLPA